MSYPLKALAAHPGRNPEHRPEGRARWSVKLPTGQTITKLGPRNPSRWLPHQGKAECARRRVVR